MIARPSSLIWCLLLVLSVVQAVKFQLPAERHPKPSKSDQPTTYFAHLTDVQNGMSALIVSHLAA
jgi:hypothetical protein